MKRSNSQITVATLFIAGGIAAGVLIRLSQLGLHPLDDAEAGLALEAFRASLQSGTQFSGQPLYLLVTTILFNFFGDSAWLARLVPALAGIALLFVPLCFQDRLGKTTVVLLVWLMAIEPALVAASRSAGSDMLALSLVVWALTSIYRRKLKTAAVLFGLACLSGPSFWVGMAILTISSLLWNWLAKPDLASFREGLVIRQPSFWWIMGSVIFLGGSALFLIPNGISAIGGSLVDFLAYFKQPGSGTIRMVLLAMPFYSPLILFAGVFGMGRSLKTKNTTGLFLSFQTIFAVLFILLAPGRDMHLMIWVSLPLSILAAREISASFSINSQDARQALFICGFVIIILIFLWQVFGTLNQGKMDSQNFLLYTGAGLVILLVCAILAILGWSVKVAGTGYAWGFTVGLALFTLMSGWRSAGISTEVQMEFWNGGSDPTQVSLLNQTVEDISKQIRGAPESLEIKFLGKMEPALAWTLRHQTIKEVDGFMGNEQPAMVITPLETQLQLSQPYRGQDFVIQSQMDWASLSVQDWLKWLMIRNTDQVPVISKILWVRGDLFPGYRSTLLPAE